MEYWIDSFDGDSGTRLRHSKDVYAVPVSRRRRGGRSDELTSNSDGEFIDEFSEHEPHYFEGDSSATVFEHLRGERGGVSELSIDGVDRGKGREWESGAL